MPKVLSAPQGLLLWRTVRAVVGSSAVLHPVALGALFWPGKSSNALFVRPAHVRSQGDSDLEDIVFERVQVLWRFGQAESTIITAFAQLSSFPSSPLLFGRFTLCKSCGRKLALCKARVALSFLFFAASQATHAEGAVCPRKLQTSLIPSKPAI